MCNFQTFQLDPGGGGGGEVHSQSHFSGSSVYVYRFVWKRFVVYSTDLESHARIKVNGNANHICEFLVTFQIGLTYKNIPIV